MRSDGIATLIAAQEAKTGRRVTMQGSPILALAIDAPPALPKSAMNGLEKRYAEHLQKRLLVGEISWWAFNRIRLKLADNCWFKPDFAVVLADGQLQFEETKGFFREAAKVRIKVAAANFPFRFVVVTEDQGEWVYKEVGT